MGVLNDSMGLPQSVLVLGGGSDIARALVRSLIRTRARTIVLGGRPGSKSLALAADEARQSGASTVGVGALRRPGPGLGRRRGRRSVRHLRRHRPGGGGLRRPGRPDAGRGRPRRRHRGRHRQLHRGRHRRPGGGPAPASPGPRNPARPVDGRRGAGPTGQLRLRLVEGGHGRVLPGPRATRWRAAAPAW